MIHDRNPPFPSDFWEGLMICFEYKAEKSVKNRYFLSSQIFTLVLESFPVHKPCKGSDLQVVVATYYQIHPVFHVSQLKKAKGCSTSGTVEAALHSFLQERETNDHFPIDPRTIMTTQETRNIGSLLLKVSSCGSRSY